MRDLAHPVNLNSDTEEIGSQRGELAGVTCWQWPWNSGLLRWGAQAPPPLTWAGKKGDLLNDLDSGPVLWP